MCCILLAEHDNIYAPRYRADVPKLERFRTVVCCWFRCMHEVCKKDPAEHLYFLASKSEPFSI